MKRIAKPLLMTALALAAAGGVARSTHAEVQKNRKVALCHGTASAKNPYVLINVAVEALNGHFDGTAPGHGKNNAPDFVSTDGSCDTPCSGAES